MSEISNQLHKQINRLVSSIVSSYGEHPSMLPPRSGELPNRDTIIQIIHLLRGLLFPGYFGKLNLTTDEKVYPIGDLLIVIREKLHKQISSVLKTKALQHAVNEAEIANRSDDIICKFLNKIPDIRDVLATDVQFAFDGDPAADDKGEIIFSYPGIFAVSIYRLAHELYLLSVPLIPRIMTEYAHSVTGIDIHPGARIGKYFFIDHGTGVVIGETTIIGDYVKIYHGVTLGALSTRGGQDLRGVKRHPTLEDEVTVYSGASILGGETVIGKGVIIASNVFITKSVPDGTRVSVKNPELLFKDRAPQEFEQEFTPDWVI